MVVTVACSPPKEVDPAAQPDKKQESKKKSNNDAKNDADAADLENGKVNSSSNTQTINIDDVDYLGLYCKNVWDLKLRQNIDTELDLVCLNQQPTDTLKHFDAIAKQQGISEIEALKLEHNEETELSDIIVAWSFNVKVHPFKVKAKPLHSYLTPGYTSDSIRFSPEKVSDNSDLDHGLHLKSVDMSYHIEVDTPINQPIIHDRNSQFNTYQVLSGNDEMGLAVEHLLDDNNPAYKQAVMMTVAYNDGSGGAVVTTFLHFNMINKGFPETSANALLEIGVAMRDLMHQGIKKAAE